MEREARGEARYKIYDLTRNVCSIPRQHSVEKLLRLPLLEIQLLRAFADQLLQVVAVLLQQLEHGVHEVDLSPVVQQLELVVRSVEIGPRLGELRPALPHDVDGLRGSSALTHRRSDQRRRPLQLLEDLCKPISI